MNVTDCLRLAADWLAPRHCVFCGTVCIAAERYVCMPCYDELPWCEPAADPAPGRFHRRIAMLDYQFPVDVAIKRLKFNRKLYYATAFADILRHSTTELPGDVDAVLPVPLHWLRHARRGFNQADELARPVARQLGVPLIRSVVRVRPTRTQSGLRATERSRNLRNAFLVKRALQYEHVLIVDDVMTTGATIEALADVVLASGVARVSALCVARSG